MAPFSAFKQLSDQARALLMSELPSNQHSSLPEIFKTPEMIMLRACRAGQTQVVREMLDMGFSADYIGDISTKKQDVSTSRLGRGRIPERRMAERVVYKSDVLPFF